MRSALFRVLVRDGCVPRGGKNIRKRFRKICKKYDIINVVFFNDNDNG